MPRRWRIGNQTLACPSLSGRHRDKITADYADLGMVENESGIGRLDTLGADRRHKMIEGSVKKFRKELNAETAKERAKLLSEQRAAKETLNLVSVWGPGAQIRFSVPGAERDPPTQGRGRRGLGTI